MMNMKNMKKIAAAALTAITLTAPLSAEAHFLSSRQEKEIGNQAVADFQAQYAPFEDPVLTHIQDRIMKAIENVGKNGGYVYIMQTGSLPYLSTTLSTDVTNDVKNEVNKLK